MDSPGSTKMEKMKAVELYLKLPPELPAPNSADNSERSLTIYSVPRGSRIDPKSGEIVLPEGVELETIEPYTATPDWTRRAASTSKREHDDEMTPTETTPVETTPTESAYDEDNLPTAPLPAATTPPASNVRPLRPYERTYFEGERHDVNRRPTARDPFSFKPRDPFDAA